VFSKRGKTLIVLIGAILGMFGPSTLASQETDLVTRFTAGFVKGEAGDILAAIHPDFEAEGMDRDAFVDWVSKWFEWCDDYHFEAPELLEVSTETGVNVSGDFQRNWLLGMEASDTSIEGAEEKEVFGSLEEEGGAVQSIDRVESITFTIVDDLIIGIEGMTLSDPKGSAMGMRDPRIRKLGEFFSGLDDLPVIGGLFSSSETAFSGAVKSLLTIAVLIAALFGGWVMLGTMVTNLRLSGVMAKHSFPEGTSYQQQHAAYTEHREQLTSEQKECRRHDFYLRQLIDEGRYEDARDYARGMIAYCSKEGDVEGSETYSGYLKRVDELEHASEYSQEHRLKKPGS
jgi:hypothetical protein